MSNPSITSIQTNKYLYQASTRHDISLSNTIVDNSRYLISFSLGVFQGLYQVRS